MAITRATCSSSTRGSTSASTAKGLWRSAAARLAGPGGLDRSGHHVDYMLDPRFFNQVPARRYVEVCEALVRVELIVNDLALDDPYDLTPDLEAQLRQPREELLASAHTLVARKRPFRGPADLSRTIRTRLGAPWSNARPGGRANYPIPSWL